MDRSALLGNITSWSIHSQLWKPPNMASSVCASDRQSCLQTNCTVKHYILQIPVTTY